MISSFAHQITELEQKLQGQNETVNKIYDCLVNYVEDRKKDKGVTTNKAALDNVQARVKENSFRINDLGSKVKRFSEELHNVKGTVLQGHWVDWNGNQHATQICEDTQALQSQDSTAPAANPTDWQYLKTNTPFSEPGTPVNAGTTTLYPDVSSYWPSQNFGSQWLDPNTPHPNDGTPLNQMDKDSLIVELHYYKNRTKELELQLKKKEDQMNDMNRQMNMGLQNEGWVEHKLKLLKQDKRRRGETIGKLLKCIDDMRDTGRLDPSRVTEGRAVLSATLASHGLPLEERVRRTVKAVEFDRVPRMPRQDADTKNKDEKSLIEENKNNSARRASLASLGSNSSLPVEPSKVQEEDEDDEEECDVSPGPAVLLSDDDDDSDEEIREELCQCMSDEEIVQVASVIAHQYGFHFNSCTDHLTETDHQDGI